MENALESYGNIADHIEEKFRNDTDRRGKKTKTNEGQTNLSWEFYKDVISLQTDLKIKLECQWIFFPGWGFSVP